MIDLSPQPRDKGSGPAPSTTPHHDPLPGQTGSQEKTRSWWYFSHEHAELAVQRFSRWAGPAVLLMTLLLLGLWLIY
ncbi:hypothetical protein [Sphingobium sp. Sx8-8]|uniref:hypothetical protein n=1 Tax=Sphingobium sp. Sx8-8 TaxID=2933617 RepID=UPI001F59C0DF|nr:hypothetical protein [Sphingobium sp. Sx8-8]